MSLALLIWSAIKPSSYDVWLFEISAGVRGHVLVIEDEKVTGDLMKKVIEREGWSVSEAENGRTALERIGERAPDIIFLDLMMPVMDGFAFIHELRKQKEHLQIPIVVVTAKDLTPAERQWLNGNVYTVFQKGSYHREELMAKIRQLVRMHAKPRTGVESG